MQTYVFGRNVRALTAAAGIVGTMTVAAIGAGIAPSDLVSVGSVSAEETAAVDYAGHPIIGAWMAATPGGPALSAFAADGSVVMGVQPTAVGPQGVSFVSAEVGMWEPEGERGVHFTAVQILSDAEGNLTGTLTIDGYPVVSEDGQSLLDDGTRATFTVRDASGAVLDASAGGPPVTALKMAVGAPGFASDALTEATPSAATTAEENENLVRATERQRLGSLVNADLEMADQLHAEDFQLINPAGGALTKEEYLGGIASGDIDYLVFEPSSEIAVRFHDDTAIVRYQSNIHIVVGGEDIVTHGWHTDLYEQRDGRWQAVWSQMTEIQ